MPRHRSRLLAVLLALAVAGMVVLVQAAAAQAAAPLVGQWPLDSARTAGGIDSTDDVSGNQLALRSASASMRFGAAQGKFGGYLSSANTTTLQATSPLLAPARLTLLAWIRQNGDPGTLRYLAGRGDDGPTCLGSSYALYTGYPGRGGLRFYVRQPGPTAESALSDAPPTAAVFDNQWHLVAGTYDGANIHLYVDGVEVGTPKPAAGIGYAPPITGSSFYVDGYPPSAGCLDRSDFPGWIDELRVYDRALTPTELGRLAAAPGPAAPVLVPDGGSEPPPTPPPPVPSPSPSPSPPSPSPPPSGGPGRATVAFGRAIVNQRPGTTVLDASRTTGARQLDWDLSGDRRADVSCPSSQPYLGVSVQRTTIANVGLSAIGGLRAAAAAPGGAGAGAFMSSRILLRGLDPSRILQRMAPPDVAICASSLRPLTVETMKFCEQQTVIWGLMSAQGCFIREDDESDVPAAERALVRAHYESAKVSAVVVAICNQAARGLKPQSLCDEARRFFRVMPYDVYVSGAGQTIDLNGIKVTPRSGARVVVFPRLNRLVSSNATVKWGGMTVRTGQLDLNFENDESVTRIHFTGQGSQRCACGRSAAIARYDGRRDLPDIGGFKLDGSVDLALEGIDGRRYSSGVMQLRLPPEFAIFGGSPPSASVRVLAQNGTGLLVDNLDISVPEAAIGPVRLTDVRFRYAARGHIDGDTDPNSTCERDEWKAQANVFLTGGGGGEAGFKLAPPPAQNGIGFCDGAFRHFGGALRFGGPIPRPQIFPGVFLDELNFAMQLRPLLIRAGGKLSVADISRVSGTLLLVFATPQQPYTLTPADAGAELGQLAGRRFDSTTIAGGGAVDLKFPGLGYLPVASAAVMYSHPDHIYAGGDVRLVGPGLAIYGHAAIEALLGRGLFTSAIGGKACLAGVKKGACLGGDGWVTSKGMVACLNIFDTLHPGAGVEWATKKVTIWPFDGCKPSRYWIRFDQRAVARAAVRDDLTFTVAKGETIKNVRLPGIGAAPQVRITAADGETLDVSGDDWVSSAHLRGVRDESANVAYIGVAKGAGRYTVTPLPGSAPLRSMATTLPGYDTHFAASVAPRPHRGAPRAKSAARVVRAGSRQVLSYDARKRGGGQRVTFVERGANLMHQLGTVTGGRGRIVYTPAPGRPERRRIVAVATVDGTPIPDQTLDSYRYGGTPRIAAPRGVRVQRRGTRLTVRWTPVRGARGYGLLLRYGVGRERQLTAGAGKRSLTIARVPLTEGGVVRVSARDALGRWGGPRTSNRFRATKPLPTLLQTDRRNEKRER